MPLLLLIRVKSAKHSLFIPVPVFLALLLWLLLLPLALVLFLPALIWERCARQRSQFFNAIKFYFIFIKVYFAFSGLSVRVKSKNGDLVLVKVI